MRGCSFGRRHNIFIYGEDKRARSTKLDFVEICDFQRARRIGIRRDA